MRVIEIPATVTLKPLGEGGKPEELSFKKWALLHIDHYAEVKTPGQIRQCAKIAAALEKEGNTQLEDAEYELLKAAIGAPKFTPGASRQLISYYDAIDGAQEVKK